MDIKQATDKRINELCRIATLAGLDVPPDIQVKYTTTGRRAGSCRYIKGDTSTVSLNFNTAIAQKYTESFLDTTVPHELAHAIDAYQHGKSGHGRPWRNIMHKLGIDNPQRCHDHDLTGIVKGYIYACECKEHILSTIRHNKVVKKGAKYRCKDCKQELIAK